MSITLPPPTSPRRTGSHRRLDDGRLARLAGRGDERAFEAIFDRHHEPLLSFCRHLVGTREEAEDVLQQVFMRADRALRAHGPPDELRPWLYAIARNCCRSALAARRDVALPVSDLEVPIDGLADEVQRRADLRALVADVGRLPADQRAALVLSELGDLSHAEIARVLECPVPKVKALVFQARETLLADRAARAIGCSTIREQLATASGAELRRGWLRRHLRGCTGCRTYADAVRAQRAALASVLPVAPTLGLKAAVLASLGGGAGASGGAAGWVAAAGGGGAASAGTAGAGAVGAGVAGSGAIAAFAGNGVLAKLVIGAVVTAGGIGGGAAVVEGVRADRAPRTTSEPSGDDRTAATAGARGHALDEARAVASAFSGTAGGHELRAVEWRADGLPVLGDHPPADAQRGASDGRPAGTRPGAPAAGQPGEKKHGAPAADEKGETKPGVPAADLKGETKPGVPAADEKGETKPGASDDDGQSKATSEQPSGGDRPRQRKERRRGRAEHTPPVTEQGAASEPGERPRRRDDADRRAGERRDGKERKGGRRRDPGASGPPAAQQGEQPDAPPSGGH